MKKSILILIVGILFIAANLYAADGNLIVDDKVGIGTYNPEYPLHIEAKDSVTSGVFIGTKGDIIADTVTGIVYGSLYGVTAQGAGSKSTIQGQQSSVRLATSDGANINNVQGINASIVFKSLGNTGTTSVDNYISGMKIGVRSQYENEQNFSVPRIIGGEVNMLFDGLGTITTTDLIGLKINSVLGGYPAGNILAATNAYGLLIDKQDVATNNYGIVLNGDGAGADIVFGPNKDASIYSNNGELFAKDGVGNVTQISPHDPRTGEWIFYSKNIKTGRTVRVNMEELIRDMEKLTGKKYMVESFVKDK